MVKPILGNARDCELLFQVAQLFARARTPFEVLEALRVGRLTALQMPNGIVAVTIAQQLRPAIERATSPFQYALSPRGRHGVHCSRHPGFDGPRPRRDRVVHRLGFSSGHVARLVACGWRRFSIALRDAVLWVSFLSFVGRSGRCRAHHHAG